VTESSYENLTIPLIGPSNLIKTSLGTGLIMFRFVRIGRRTIGGAMLAASFIAFFSSNQFALLKLAFGFYDPFSITQYRMSRLSDEEYKTAIEQSLEEGDISDAQSLVDFARENGRELPTELVERTQENPFEFGLRNTLDLVNGARTGEMTSMASAGGVLAADYVGVGDVRDILIQGNNLVQGESYDKITLGFALVGAATSATIAAASAGTFITSGAATPVTGPALALATTIDNGASIVKNANKMRKLSKPLVKQITRISTNLVNVEPLKKALTRVSLPLPKWPSLTSVRNSLDNLDWHDLAKGDFSRLKKPLSEMMPTNMGDVETALKGVVRTDELENAKILAKSVGGIVAAGDVKTAFRAMEYADDAKDLSRFQKLAASMKGKTSAAIRVLGKGAIKLGKLFYRVIIILIAVLGWVLGALWFLYSMVRFSYRMVRRVRGVT
jgi:hypothetical protein